MKQPDIIHRRRFIDSEACRRLEKQLESDIDWQIVKYRSERFGKQCITPCKTYCFGGDVTAEDYQPMPPFIEALAERVRNELGIPTNVVLCRRYEAMDHIAWHTDARAWLKKGNTNVVSLSFGATRRFQVRSVTPLWPKQGVKTEYGPVIDYDLHSGDLLIMQGDTQEHFHHRVRPEKRGTPGVRYNLNFRFIEPSAPKEVQKRGHDTYYKYCVYGDNNKRVKCS